MQKIKCEICGSSNIVKDKGLFTCRTCGVKYTANEVKKIYEEINKNYMSPTKIVFTDDPWDTPEGRESKKKLHDYINKQLGEDKKANNIE